MARFVMIVTRRSERPGRPPTTRTLVLRRFGAVLASIAAALLAVAVVLAALVLGYVLAGLVIGAILAAVLVALLRSTFRTLRG